jgi:flagella basal body P-ring formation protein FlgA
MDKRRGFRSTPSLRAGAGVLLFAAVSSAIAAPDWEDVARIRQTAVTAASAAITAGDRVEASVDERLRLPRCKDPLESYPVASAGLTAQTIGVRCTAPAWVVYVPVRVSAVRLILVAARPLARGEATGPDAFRLERRDLAGLQRGYLSDPASLQGRQLTRAVAAGSPLAPSDFAAGNVIRRGQQVVLFGRAGGLEVRARGKALADAALNQRLSVENLSSRRIIEGFVRSADTVEVGL